MKTHLNLLPQPVVQRQTVAKQLRVWMYVALAVIVFAIGWTVYLDHQTAQAGRQHAELEDAHQATQVTLRSIRRLRGELVHQHQSREPALADNQQEVLALLGMLAAAAEKSDGGIAVERFHYVSTAALTADEDRTNESFRVELRGVAADPLTVAALVTSIQSWEMFTKVELKSSGPVQVGQQNAHRYVIECLHTRTSP